MGLTNAEIEFLKKDITKLKDDEKKEYKRIRQKKYQQDYRNKLKESKESKPVKEKIPIKSKKEVIIVKPQWYNNLIKKYPKFKINDANYIAYRAYTEKQIEDFNKKITKLLKNIFYIDLSTKTKAIVVSIFRGKNVEQGRYKTNLDSFNNEFKMFNQKNIIKTLEKISDYYKNMNNTIKNNITPFVNLFSRIDSYENTYQIMTNYNIDLNQKYISKRENNEPTSDEELEKLKTVMDNYDPKNPEDTKKKINDAELNSKDKFLASLYLLMPVRRLEYKIMKLTNTLDNLDENFNYLYIKGKKSKFIFNKYKTAEKGGKIKTEVFGKQELDVNDDVLQYLKQYIKESKIKNGDLLFGEMSLSTYSKMVQDIMEIIFNVKKIGATTLRTVASSYNQQDNTKSVKDKRQLADQMGHDLNTNALYNKITNVRLDRKRQVSKKNKIPIE
tara:strand:+ start:1491 stop:2819 length:1329 start_codon:yes stop_codon:yes gene_type:complete